MHCTIFACQNFTCHRNSNFKVWFSRAEIRYVRERNPWYNIKGKLKKGMIFYHFVCYVLKWSQPYQRTTLVLNFQIHLTIKFTSPRTLFYPPPPLKFKEACEDPCKLCHMSENMETRSGDKFRRISLFWNCQIYKIVSQ